MLRTIGGQLNLSTAHGTAGLCPLSEPPNAARMGNGQWRMPRSEKNHYITAVEPRDRVPGQLVVLLHDRSEAQVSCAAVLWGPRKCGGEKCIHFSTEQTKARSTERTKKRRKNRLEGENLPPN